MRTIASATGLPDAHPLHTLPHAELMAKHGALTTPRVVRDAPSTIAWKLDIGPFPGWKDVPT